MKIKHQPKKEPAFWATTRTADVLWQEILRHLQSDWSELFKASDIVCAADVVGEGLARRVTLQGNRPTATGQIDFSIYLRMREVEDYADQFVMADGGKVEVLDVTSAAARKAILDSLGAGEMMPERKREIGYILEVEYTYAFIPKRGPLPSPDMAPEKNTSIGGNCITSSTRNPDPFMAALVACSLA